MSAGRYIKSLRRRWWLLVIIIPMLIFLLIRPPGFHDPYSTVMEDRNGKLLGALIADDGQWRFPPPDSIPGKIQKCIILFEDKNFRYHPGVDLSALVRAMYLNIKHRKIVSGGSTISMQVIRLMRKGKARTLWEKAIEMTLSFRLEMIYSKEDILSMYLSHAPFGGNVVGLEAASWRYFGCIPADLTWADAATLAVLPNAPSIIHPGRNREELLEKRNKMLSRLLEEDMIDSLTWMLSCSEPLPGKPKPLPQTGIHLLASFHSTHRGQRVITTVDEHLQRQVQELLNRHVRLLKQNEIHNAAALVLDVESGRVLAYVGNTTIPGGEHGEMVDVVRAARSSGSILKPLLYAASLQEGRLLPKTLIPDIPTRMTGFSPKNFSGTFDGAVPADRALSRSLNIPAVKMLQDYGVERFQIFLKEIGMSSLFRPAGSYGLSLILGGAEAKLWDLAGMYASMSRVLNHFYAYSGKYDPGDIHPPVLFAEAEAETSLMDETQLGAAAIWLTYSAMEEVNRPDVELNWKKFSSARRIAWKTGTSFGFRDAWAVGTDPSYVVAVWAGNADGEGRPGLTGVVAAAPLLFEIFNLLPSAGWFDPPYDEMEHIAVCRHSGYRMGPYCEVADSMWVPLSGLRSAPCPYHQLVHLDPEENYRVNEQCMAVDKMVHKKWFVLPPAMEWYYKSAHPWYKELPPYMDACKQLGEEAIMSFIYPDWGSQIFIPVGLDGTREQTILEIAHRNPEATIYWHLDETYLGETSFRHQMGIRPEKGEHIVTAVDADGEAAVVRFTVVSEF